MYTNKSPETLMKNVHIYFLCSAQPCESIKKFKDFKAPCNSAEI